MRYQPMVSVHAVAVAARKIFGYTAAAGGLAFAGGDAMGAIVHNTTGALFSAQTTNPANYEYNKLLLDLDGAGGADLGFYISIDMQPGEGSVGAALTSLAASQIVGPDPSSGSFARNLKAGFVVGPTLASGSFGFGSSAWLYFYGTAQGNYPGTLGPFGMNTGYIGVRFDGDTGTVGTQYAWLKVKFDRTTSPNKLTMNVLEWAYDNSGCPIAVGATTGGGDCGNNNNNSVDSPATPLLSLLGPGAMGVATYRRRREAGIKRLVEAEAGAAA